MAASCCFTSAALFPLWRPRRRHGIIPSDSGSQRLPDRRVGLSFRTERRLRPRKSASRLCVFRLGDTKPAVVTGKTWDKLILESDTPVLVEFYTNWCGPCRMVHRVIAEIATEYSSKINCFVLDADCDSEVAENYDIKSVPVALLFKNGKKLESITGTMPKEFYVATIERVLAS